MFTIDTFNLGSPLGEKSGLEQTSPVGLFPAGASPCGALDMAGNVWQWTASRWGRTSVFNPDYGYPYRPDDGREEPDGPDLRGVRGGSWFDGLPFVRCAYRYRSVPSNFLGPLGVSGGVVPGEF